MQKGGRGGEGSCVTERSKNVSICVTSFMNTPLLDLMMTETDRAEGMLQAHGRALNFALQQDWTTSAKIEQYKGDLKNVQIEVHAIQKLVTQILAEKIKNRAKRLT